MKKMTLIHGIWFLVIVFLLPVFVNAGDLGPSCTSRFKNLPLTGFKMESGVWCWAATAQSVMTFHEVKKEKQCELVGKVFNLPCCGDNPPTDCLIIDDDLSHPESVFDKYQFSYWPPTFNGKLTWTTTTEEICQNRPLISSVKIDRSGPGHSVVVYGYTAESTHGEVLSVFDPAGDGDYIYPYAKEFFNENPEEGYTHVRDTYKITPKPTN